MQTMGYDHRRSTLADIERVYHHRNQELQRVATAITGNWDTAWDAVQDGFARAVQRRHTYRGDGPLEGWIWRIVVNAAREIAASEVAPLTEDASASASVSDESLASGGELRDAVLALPERQRLALFLRYYADLDYATIAGALEIREGTVGALLNQARADLRNRLTEVRT
jgi:RNA polymerase sigma-70 factor (ECF subfamily)